MFTLPQVTTYRDSLNQDKKTYNYTARTYIKNIYNVQTFLNSNPKATNIQEPDTNYITQKLTGYNKLIALPKTKPSLVKTCYEYGLLSTVYTTDGTDISTIPEIYEAFTIFKRITKGTLFFIKIYTAPAEILFDEVKKPINLFISLFILLVIRTPLQMVSELSNLKDTEVIYVLELVIY